jgi:hypothetical protein
MNHKELVVWANDEVDTTVLKIKDIHGVNFDPHPYVIGNTHITRNKSMYLGSDQIREMEREHGPMCYYKSSRRGSPRCSVPYDDHKSDTVAFVELQKDVTSDEVGTELMKLKDKFEEEKIDGFAFIDTGYRVIDAEQENSKV